MLKRYSYAVLESVFVKKLYARIGLTYSEEAASEAVDRGLLVDKTGNDGNFYYYYADKNHFGCICTETEKVYTDRDLLYDLFFEDRED